MSRIRWLEIASLQALLVPHERKVTLSALGGGLNIYHSHARGALFTLECPSQAWCYFFGELNSEITGSTNVVERVCVCPLIYLIREFFFSTSSLQSRISLMEGRYVFVKNFETSYVRQRGSVIFREKPSRDWKAERTKRGGGGGESLIRADTRESSHTHQKQFIRLYARRLECTLIK